MYKFITGLAGLLVGGLAGCLSAPEAVWPPSAMSGFESLFPFLLTAAAGLGVGIVGGSLVDRHTYRAGAGRMTRWTAMGCLIGAVGGCLVPAVMIGPIIAWGTAAVGCLAGAVTGLVAALLVGPDPDARRARMDAEEPDASAAIPAMYCIDCLYALTGLTKYRCPECGRSFDPSRPRTYRHVPWRQWWRRTGVRPAMVLLVLATLVGGGLYQRHAMQRAVIRQIYALGGSVRTAPIAPTWVPNWIRPHIFGLRTNVKTINFNGKPITDNDLKLLKGLTNLEGLALMDTRVTDAGLEHIRHLTNLQWLNIGGTRVTDAGLVHLKGLAKLHNIQAKGTSVTGVGFAHLAGLPSLTVLNLSNSPITDAGLAQLKALTNLRDVDLAESAITDTGLTHLKALTNLRQLNLAGTAITDAGLSELKGLTNLNWVDLQGTAITDDGMQHLEALSQLVGLRVDDTHVTVEGTKNLLQAIPNIRIYGVMGVLLPEAGPVNPN